uniref:BRO1 domain-containing protein n=1 Tax=Globisporangium ultimum (strain ATCC 200006 / CBS 805.95 / DAOM BR144) TaxID=431595 RepID=K3X6D6_GLOUD
MLGIGFKQSDTPLPSLRRPLQEYIQREYASPSSSSPTSTDALSATQQDALDKFFQLKTDVDLVRTPSTISRHVLLRYYAQLDRFVARFPCDATGLGPGPSAASLGPPQPVLRLQFTWNDSFCPRKKITQANVRFEQAAVMFNYGALESQMGVQTDRSSADGLKAACKHFMLAAGAFSCVTNELVAQCLGARTPDMSAEGLGLLTYLMLAQAQACFYEKSIKDQMKDGIKAKLAHQALEYYVSALDFCNSSALSGTIDRTWSVHLLFQVQCMKAATQYWQAKASKEIALTRGTGYGEEIARLMAADAECQEATKVATQNKLPMSLLESVKTLQRVVREHLHLAQKDNASVYLENIPKFSDLPAIGKVNMVKALALTNEELAQELGGDLFEQFVPNSILRQAADVKEEIKQLLAATTEKVSESNEMAKSKLQSLELPASIEAFEKTSDNGIPATIWQKIQYIQTVNRIIARSEFSEGELENNPISALLQQRLKDNQGASDTAEKKLHMIETRLAEEEIEDNVCRQNYGSKRWSRPVSTSLNENFRADIDRYYRLVQEAKKSDEIVRDKLHTNGNKLAALGQTKAALDRQLPLLQQENSSCSHEIGVLSTLLLRLGSLIDEKDQVIKDFSTSYEKFNALPVLLNGSKATPADTEVALAAEKQFFSTHFVGKVDSICADEQSLLGQIVEANADFEARKADDSVIQARQAFLQGLSDAVDIFEQLESHVKEGNKFYEELEARIDQLHQTVADHCAAREMEKRELELNIASDEEMKKNEANDAALAQQMMASMQVRDATTSQSQGHNQSSDEAFARQLAGNASQYYYPPPPPQQQGPPSYDYARAQSQQQQNFQGYNHPYAVYQQGSPSHGSYPSPSASAPQFGNFYNQAQQQSSQPPQYQQPPPQRGYGYYPYPGYQQQQQPPPQQNYSTNNGLANASHNHPGGSV